MHALSLLLAACGPGPDVPRVPADPAGDGDTGGPADTAEAPVCLGEPHAAVLSEHLATLRYTADAVEGHPSSMEAVSFLALPGVLGSVATYATLVEACSAPLTFDPACDAETCSRLSCTGDGAGWSVETWFVAEEADGWAVAEGRTVTTWDPDVPEAVAFTLAAGLRSPGGDDWTVEGAGAFAGGVTLTETFAALIPGVVLTLVYTGDAGTISVDGAVVARIEGTAITGVAPCE